MDIAELGYKVDSSGLLEGTKALDQNAAAADKAGGAAERLEKDYQSMSRAIEQSSRSLGDRLGGALDRITAGTGGVISELQALNRTQREVLAALGSMEGRLSGAASGLQSYGAAGQDAAAGAAAAATASERLQQELAQQEARYRSVAQQGMAFAEAGRTANLSERALAEAARNAASGIDLQAQAMARAGTEQERMAARARALEEAEARVQREAAAAARATQEQEVNLKQLLGQINPTVAALNRLADMEDRLEKAGSLGLIKPQVLQQYQGQIEASRQALLRSRDTTEQYGMTARQTAAALRMIPAQMTDIATSIASGQPLWMVAIQQGGQLKDQLGGIGPAARAVGGYVAGLINPLTAAAALLAALALAAKQSQDQLFQFQRELILTGQSSVIGAAGFEAMTRSLDRLEGVSRGGAAAALTATAKAGRFAGEQFDLVAAAAARMEASAERSLATTVGAFEAIAKDPVEGLLKLNDAERFLTASQLQRIIALREEGHSQEAANEAIQLYAAHLDDVADRMEEVMPAMSQAWRDVKDDIGGAWSALGGFTSAVTDLASEWGILARLPRLSDVLGLGVVGGTIMKNLGLPSVTDTINGYAKLIRGGASQLPAAIDEETLDPQVARDLAAVAQERATAEQAASEAINAQVAGLDRAAAKEAARLKIIAQYNRLADNDARHFDGSMDRLIAQSNAKIDKQFNQHAGIGKRNSDDTSAQSFVAGVQRQIEANNQLATSGEKVTASDRMVIQARQLLADKTNTMTGATRNLLQALIPQLQASDAAAIAEKQRQRDLAANIALTERLTQLEKQRQEQADIDLMGIGRGADATQMLQRQLDIQRQYLQEKEKLEKAQRDKDTALSDTEYQAELLKLDTSLARSLEIERTYQQRRMALLSDWRTGFARVWEDYVFAAGAASEHSANLLANSLSSAEDAFVKFAQTGKLSFTSLANSIIADLVRIQSQKAIAGIGNVLSGLFGQSAAATDGYVSDYNAIYGGGRASGGPVSSGKYYEVGEQDRPELLQQGGKNYLIPGNDGTVIPMARAASSAATGDRPIQVNIPIQVNVDSNGNASAEASGAADYGQQLGKSLEPLMNQWAVKSLRPGGLLAGVMRG